MLEIGAPGENKIFDRTMTDCFLASRQRAKNQNQSMVQGGLARGLSLFIEMAKSLSNIIFPVSFKKLCCLITSVTALKIVTEIVKDLINYVNRLINNGNCTG